MKRVVFALVTALLLAPVRPAGADDAPSAAVGRDRLAELVGTWTCRTGTELRARVFVQQPDANTIVMRRETYYQHNSVTRRETFHAAPGGGWTVDAEGTEFHGQAGAWTGDTWVVDGKMRPAYQAQPAVAALHFERLDANTLRMFASVTEPYAYDAVLCRRGDAPPDATACVAPHLPPYTVAAAPPETPVEAMRERIGGTVQVLVSLDADSHVVSVAIKSSPSPLLNGSSLSAARRSTYRTAIRDCKPVPSQYVFSIDYIPG